LVLGLRFKPSTTRNSKLDGCGNEVPFPVHKKAAGVSGG
jgi:hypothetical protein